MCFSQTYRAQLTETKGGVRVICMGHGSPAGRVRVKNGFSVPSSKRLVQTLQDLCHRRARAQYALIPRISVFHIREGLTAGDMEIKE